MLFLLFAFFIFSLFFFFFLLFFFLLALLAFFAFSVFFVVSFRFFLLFLFFALFFFCVFFFLFFCFLRFLFFFCVFFLLFFFFSFFFLIWSVSLNVCQHCSCTSVHILCTPANVVTSALAQVFSKTVIHGIESQHSFNLVAEPWLASNKPMRLLPRCGSLRRSKIS